MILVHTDDRKRDLDLQAGRVHHLDRDDVHAKIQRDLLFEAGRVALACGRRDRTVLKDHVVSVDGKLSAVEVAGNAAAQIEAVVRGVDGRAVGNLRLVKRDRRRLRQIEQAVGGAASGAEFLDREDGHIVDADIQLEVKRKFHRIVQTHIFAVCVDLQNCVVRSLAGHMDAAIGIEILRREHERELHVIHRLDPFKAHEAYDAVRIVKNVHILDLATVLIQTADIVVFDAHEVKRLDTQNVRYRDVALVDTSIRVIRRVDVDVIRHIQIPRDHRHVERSLAVHKVILRERHGLVLHVLHVDRLVIRAHQRVAGERLIRIVINDGDFLDRVAALEHQWCDRLIVRQIAESVSPAGSEARLIEPRVRGTIGLRAKLRHTVGIAFRIDTCRNAGFGRKIEQLRFLNEDIAGGILCNNLKSILARLNGLLDGEAVLCGDSDIFAVNGQRRNTLTDAAADIPIEHQLRNLTLGVHFTEVAAVIELEAVEPAVLGVRQSGINYVR